MAGIAAEPAHTGIVGLKATHGRVPLTGHWPRVPRRLWHIGPMARSVRDVALAYSIIAGPDGRDGFSTLPPTIDVAFILLNCQLRWDRISVGRISQRIRCRSRPDNYPISGPSP